MAKLVSFKEIEVANYALSTLRAALGNTPGKKMEPKHDLETIKAAVQAADSALTPCRSDPCSTSAKNLMAQFDHLQKTASNRLMELNLAVLVEKNDPRPRRGQMTVAEKSRYVATYGRAAFESLPN